MAMLTCSAQYLDDNIWEISATSDDASPLFYIWVDGVLWTITHQTITEIYVENGGNILIDVFDDAGDTPEDVYPSRFLIQWYCIDATVDYFGIDEYVSAVWTERKRISNAGIGYYRWITRTLEDVTEHSFRVRAVGENGNSGTVATLSNRLMVRPPDVPSCSYSYDADTQTVTVTAS